ncbi:MAG: hypothetical protein ACRCU9_16590 [Iodobacter sp.]
MKAPMWRISLLMKLALIQKASPAKVAFFFDIQAGIIFASGFF